MSLLRQGLFVIFTLALGGFFGCLLLRYGPGFDADERDLDARYSSATLEALHQARAGEQNVAQFYLHYLVNALHGDLGVSTSLELPVSKLIASRAPTTLRLIASGVVQGWAGGLILGLLVALLPAGPIPIFAEGLSSLCLCFPAAVLALMLYLSGGSPALVIGATVFPRVYSYSRTLFSEALARPYVLNAAARGISKVRILWRYVTPPAIAPLAALLGVSITIAFGAAIPVEAMCDIPGLGQLAWKATISRDLPLLAAMMLVVTGITLTANTTAGLAK